MTVTAVIMLPGYGNECQEHLLALEKHLRRAGVGGDFLPLSPFKQRPYLSHRQVVQKIATRAQEALVAHSDLLLAAISMGGTLGAQILRELVLWGVDPNRLKAILVDPPFGTHNITGMWRPLTHSVGATPGIHHISGSTAQIAALHKAMKGFKDPGFNLKQIHFLFNEGNTVVIRSDEARRDWQRVLPGAQFWAVRDGQHSLASFEKSADCRRIFKQIAASL